MGLRRRMKAVAKRNRTLDSIGQMTRKALTAGKDRRRVDRASPPRGKHKGQSDAADVRVRFPATRKP